MQEADFWTMKHEKLCPVLFSAWGGFFLVMPKADELTQAEYDALDVEAWKKCYDWTLPEAGKESDITPWCIPVEDKKSSFGIYKGRIVAVDYGS